MRCRKCDQQAAIRMRQHRLAFCRDHFLEWMLDQTARFIKKYRMFTIHERILVAVSGGKDSLSLWDVLWRLGYQADGLYIHLGIQGEDDYSARSETYARQFAAERGLNLIVRSVEESSGRAVPVLAHKSGWGKERPCGVCGIVKRHLMNESALQGGYDVLATAHNLDDEAAFLMQNTLIWQVQFMRRQFPVLEGGMGFARKVKPFCRFYERETAAYAILRGIPYIEEECPFADGSKQLEYKALLNRMESERTGAKLQFFVGFLNARQEGFFSALPGEDDEEGGRKRCPRCGQPTTRSDLCSYCRLIGE